ncbi:MAG: N-acetyltransferase [Gemmatimonadota bacterium]
MTGTTSVTLREVRGKRDLSNFIKVAEEVYRGDPAWVPPLRLERKLHFSSKHNPYFRHARMKAWVAYRDGVPVGRITAQVDELDRRLHGADRGHFGFLEAQNDPDVFAALFAEAEAWLKSQGVGHVLGPFNFSINQECGLLVEGFHRPPVFMMPHGKPYYPHRLAELGYGKAKDLLAFWIEKGFPWPRTAQEIVKRYSRRITTRTLDAGRVEEELELLRDIFNDAWSENWGFVPFTQAEFMEMGKSLRLLVDDEFVQVAEVEGEPAAFIVLLPNLNEAIRDLGGRLLPFGWAKVLARWKGSRIRTGRIVLMGVRKAYQNSLMAAALALSVIDRVHAPGLARGYEAAELSWVLEDNTRLLKILDSVGAQPYKRYRIFEKRLEDSREG